MSRQNKKCIGFDVTVPFKVYPSVAVVKELLVENGMKNFIFQEERGKTLTEKNPEGYHHWQVRGRLGESTRVITIENRFKALKCYATVTTNVKTGVFRSNNFEYVMKKDDTFLSGPYTDRPDDNVVQSTREAKGLPPLTAQLEEFNTHELYPWQKQVVAIAKGPPEFRKIHFIYDPIGDAGKSIFAEWMEYHDLAEDVPTFTLMEDLLQFVSSCCFGKKCYMIDMPRGMKKERLSGFYSGIEVLKNGRVYDKRHKGMKRRMNRPHIIVYSNCLPNLKLLSADRWVIWQMMPNHSLSLQSGPLKRISADS